MRAGGYGEAKGRFNDVYVFDTVNHRWHLSRPSGDLPKPIYLHSVVQHGSSMIVFGGNSGKECNDMYSYEVTRGHWTKFPTPGLLSSAAAQFPAPRYGHASCVYGGNHLLIVGGCKSNNTYFKDAYSMNCQRQNDMHGESSRRLGCACISCSCRSLSACSLCFSGITAVAQAGRPAPRSGVSCSVHVE